MSRFRANNSRVSRPLVAGCLLVACAEEDAGPQFATDPGRHELQQRPRRAIPGVAAYPAAIATPASFTDLLAVRGAASALFVVSANDVWSVSGDGEAARLFAAPDGSRFSPSTRHPMGRRLPSSWRRTQAGGKRPRWSSSMRRIGRGIASTAPVGASATPVARDAEASQRLTGRRKETGFSHRLKPGK